MVDKDFRKPTEHSMKRRSRYKEYSWRGIYHITINVNPAYRMPLGRVVGRLDAAEGSLDAPHVELTEAGRMVEAELMSSISTYYPMVEVQDHVVMPEHLHCILEVKRDIVSQNGLSTHLGQVIAGFKKGCNRRFWELQGMLAGGGDFRGEPENTGSQHPVNTGRPQDASTNSQAGGVGRCLAVSPQRYKVPSGANTGRVPLFESGYCDVMPIDEAQLETQRAYIRNNPRNRLLRMSNRQWMLPQRMCVETHLSLRALKGYLQRECLPSQITEEIWQRLSERLLVKDGMVYCDRYGSDELLTKRLLPVVCHRKDAALHDTQLLRCMDAADEGDVLVSARIAKREQIIMAAVQKRSYPVVLIADNGFPEIFHPSEEKQTLCASGRLLLLTPWKYHYRKADEGITVAECKTMNCITQAVCRLRDDWWK